MVSEHEWNELEYVDEEIIPKLKEIGYERPSKV